LRADDLKEGVRTMARWPLLLGALAAVVAGVVAWFVMRPGPAPTPVVAGTVAPSVPAPAPPPAPAATPAPGAPSFDIVRVTPEGNAVIAGRAAPSAEVTLRDNGTAIGSVKADEHGQFVFVPAAPLPAGGSELTLTARGPNGSETAASAPVVVVVPGPPAAVAAGAPPPGPALAVLVPPDAAPRVLQAPADNARAHGQLGLGVVDYDDHGNIRFAGSAPPGATVQVYVDNAMVGTAVTAPDGHWTLTPHEGAIAPGAHQVRVDALAAGGRVIARVELPFQREALASQEVPADRFVVQPGHSLWRIAHRVYGSGVRYAVIYQANRDQIRDPDLIYPGQIFKLPGAAPAPAGSMPTPSASKSR
jgi:nucleoid-associated protein YgaU